MLQKITLVLMLLSLVGCHSVKNIEKSEVQSEEQPEGKNEEQTVVYSFTGETEGLSLDNGVIVLSPTQQTLYGGELQNNQEDLSDISNYSVVFFISSDGGKENVLTYGTGDLTEELRSQNLKVPGITSQELFKTNIQDHIKNNFYVEVIITKTNGEKQSYQIKLDATEVTQTMNNSQS